MDAKLLEHLVHVRQTAHLAGAIRTLVTDCCTVAPSGVWRARQAERQLTDSEATVCQLVLKEAYAEHLAPHPAQAALQQAVYGAGSTASFMQLVVDTSFQQARLVAAACASLLQDYMLRNPEVCYAVLRLADEAAVPCLRAAALLVALRHFTEACCSGNGHVLALPAHLLRELLEHDDLAVSSEMDAFHGLACWVEHAPARASCLADLLDAGVRLEHLSLGELAAIDGHPLVWSCGRATRLVADEYVRQIVQAPSAGARSARSAPTRRRRGVLARGDPAGAGGGQAERADARCTHGGPYLSGEAAAPVAAAGAGCSPGRREASAPAAGGRPHVGLAAEMRASPLRCSRSRPPPDGPRQPCVHLAAEVEAGPRRHDPLAPSLPAGGQPGADPAAAGPGSPPPRAAAAGVRRRLRME